MLVKSWVETMVQKKRNFWKKCLYHPPTNHFTFDHAIVLGVQELLVLNADYETISIFSYLITINWY